MGNRRVRYGPVMSLASRVFETPHEIAVRDDHRSLDWTQLDEVLRRSCEMIRSLPGFADDPHQRIAVFAANSIETAVVHVAALLAGASTVPVNFHLTDAEVEFILRDSGAFAVLCGPDTVERAVSAAAGAGVEHVIGWRCDAPRSWEAMLAAAPAAEIDRTVRPRPNLMYTSGTTGVPKAVELPPALFAGGDTIDAHLVALEANRFAQLGTHLVVGPMYHTGPLSGVRVLAAGVPVVVLDRFDAHRTLDAIEEHAIESTVMVPTHFRRMLALPQAIRLASDTSSLRLVAHTGALCPIDVKRDMIEWFGPVFVDAYGATEVGTICSINSEDWLEHPGSVGRVVPPFTRAIVVDDDGNEVEPGVEGTLYFEDSTGRGVVYATDPAKTAAAHLRPGVFTIGEVGYVDPDGFVYLTDRSSDMIVSGGVNIYPAEAEAVLLTHPDVADVAVIGVPDDDMGEAVRALVVLADSERSADGDEMLELCRAQLASYKCPRTIEFVSTIGRNAMGKVNKRSLRAPYWEQVRR
jgi:long-chain acyl-CoA synthetase